MYETEIYNASRKHLVPEAWIKATIQTESSWRPRAYRAEPQINDASYGLMQLLMRTARGLGFSGTEEQLYDPATNIDLGTKLLGQWRAKVGDDYRRVYSAYNSGSPDKWQTSTQVAQHVANALKNLQTYVATEVARLTGDTVQAAEKNPALFGLVVFLVLWSWTGKRS